MKYFFIALFLLSSLFSFGQAKVDTTGSLVPTGPYPVVSSKDVKGNVFFVQSISDRNAIPSYLRTPGSMAYVMDRPDSMYYLRAGVSNGDWVGFKPGASDSTGAGTFDPGSTHIETTGTYTVPDTVNNVILQYGGGSTITLPDPGSYDKREITLRNVSGNGATFNYSLVYGPGNTSNTLVTDKWVRIKSDGTDWNVVQESGSGDQINITGGGGIIIDNF